MAIELDKKGTLIPLTLAIAAAAVYLMVLTSRERGLMKGYELASVLVAKTDLPERALINESMVNTVKIPMKYVAADAIEVRDPSDIKLINSMVARIRIPKGNQLTKSALVSISPTSGMAMKIPPGYRGAVLPVDKNLMGMMKPGDRVDIVIAFKAEMPGQVKRVVAATVLQNVLVLGVGNDLGQGIDAKSASKKQEEDEKTMAFAEEGFASVAVNPLEYQYLVLAQEQGKVHVALRGIGDLEMHPIRMATLSELFGN
ncbi:MAG: Flp pilus assembly protein CpaB [Elusimicrobiota bacterium]